MRYIRRLLRHIPFLRDFYITYLSSIVRELRIALHAIANGQLRRMLGGSPAREIVTQVPRCWRSRFSGVTSIDELTTKLEGLSVTYFRGGYTIYVPPQANLMSFLPEAVSAYPPDAGFKILANPGKVGTAKYGGRLRKDVVNSLVLGDVSEQVLAANFLFEESLGPKLYDVTSIDFGTSMFTAFVVEHIDGEPPNEDEFNGFVKKLRGALDGKELMSMQPNWSSHRDYKYGPDIGNGPHAQVNVLKRSNDESIAYVDFQYFLVKSPQERLRRLASELVSELHFGTEYRVRGGRYLYQSIPGVDGSGKRDIGRRWDVFESLFDRCGIDLKGRPVLDIGCNAGGMIGQALSKGASWGIGWDKPPVVEAANKLLRARGFTRFDLVGGDFAGDHDFVQDVPDWLRSSLGDSVLFYLAVTAHFGMADDLDRLPWDVMVFEGHQHESIEDLERAVASLRKPRKIQASIVYQDGDSNPRPLVIVR